MAEKPFTGLTAAIKIKSGTDTEAKVLAYISGFNLSLSKDIIEILQFGAQYKEKVGAIKDWSASVDGTAAFVTGGTQAELLAAFENNTPLTFEMLLDTDTKFSGTGLVESIEMDAAPDDKISISASIAGTGAVTSTLRTDTP